MYLKKSQFWLRHDDVTQISELSAYLYNITKPQQKEIWKYLQIF